MQRQLLLASVVKAVDDTLGSEGVVPSELVFGEYPSLRSFEGPTIPRPSLAERAVIAQKARRLMGKHLAQARFKCALRHNTPSATEDIFQIGDKVLVWLENLVESRICEWVWPVTVCSYDAQARIALVQEDENPAHERYSLTQVRPF